MVLTVNGIDMTPYVAFQGFKWQRADVESPESGRTLDGLMHRGRVATKYRLDITCRPMKSNEAQIVLQAIKPEYVFVTYYDPEHGIRNNVMMYSNNNPASFCKRDEDGTEWWMGITFPLIER